jgi:hypothetical protein
VNVVSREEYKAVIRRLAIKRQLRRRLVHVPGSIWYDLHKLRQLRSEKL